LGIIGSFFLIATAWDQLDFRQVPRVDPCRKIIAGNDHQHHASLGGSMDWFSWEKMAGKPRKNVENDGYSWEIHLNQWISRILKWRYLTGWWFGT